TLVWAARGEVNVEVLRSGIGRAAADRNLEVLVAANRHGLAHRRRTLAKEARRRSGTSTARHTIGGPPHRSQLDGPGLRADRRVARVRPSRRERKRGGAV